MLNAPRQITVMTLSLIMATAMYPVRSLLSIQPLLLSQHHLVVVPRMMASSAAVVSRRSYIHNTKSLLFAAAPGVQVASPDAIRQALQDPSTTIVDARSVGELEQNGFYNNNAPGNGPRWVHAEATAQQAPLLQIAASALLPNKDAPVVIYCGSGIRATTSKNVLEQQGYTNVLNAGGLADLQQVVVESEKVP